MDHEETLDDIADQNDCHGELERNTRTPRMNVTRFHIPKWRRQLLGYKSQAKIRKQRERRSAKQP